MSHYFLFCLMGIQGACGAVQVLLRSGSRAAKPRSRFKATTSRFNGLRPFNAAEPRAWPLCGV
jgi:hypothetical protein